MANAAAAAAAKAQHAIEQSKLPLFHADPKKDQYKEDQWLERFEHSRAAGRWSAKRTKSYFYNALQDIVKIDTDNFQAVRTTFLQNFGVQTNNWIVITDFTSMKQMKDKKVQHFFIRIGDIAYNYDLK
jgi:hypothetical protein